MGISKRILILTLGFALAFCVLSPVCCAHDWSELGSHSHHADTHHHDHSGCDSPLLKALSNPGITSANPAPNAAFPVIMYASGAEVRLIFKIIAPLTQGHSFADASPPLYLLNSVFLN